MTSSGWKGLTAAGGTESELTEGGMGFGLGRACSQTITIAATLHTLDAPLLSEEVTTVVSNNATKLCWTLSLNSDIVGFI